MGVLGKNPAQTLSASGVAPHASSLWSGKNVTLPIIAFKFLQNDIADKSARGGSPLNDYGIIIHHKICFVNRNFVNSYKEKMCSPKGIHIKLARPLEGA